jgi:hypothetical protein
LPDEKVYTLYAQVRAFTGTTRITVIDKGKLKQRSQFIDDTMMYHPVAKVGGKDFSLYRLVDNKGNGLARLKCRY